ncbi:uncharacterized protein MELLADRAFT_115584 [Melampsora larici-populina 98AG31]|uniref:Protein phosphatase n=1 Tax=Melampsora larici-populina (strain 98AG31 / pathotype 3-4-7) TaxID=747676 RepID=F4RBW6_MELLP|nr:uncharacterized protein MELLADRAFT_115584 [Melampsora larici-populina 98AG31]EGG10268.1 hypothetical protein MELLADRAFT_115584 [Melampsora larici-populina 98AG31]
MGVVPGSRAFSFASKSTKDSNLNLLFRTIKPTQFLTPISSNSSTTSTNTRTLTTSTTHSNHLPAFFDPSTSDCSSSSSLLSSSRHHPDSTSLPSSPSSPSPSSSTTTSQPKSNPSQPPVTRLSTSTGSSHDSNQTSSNLSSSSSSSSIRSTNLSQLSPLNLYGHPITTHPSNPSKSNRPKKHYYSFTNAASGIPKTSAKSLFNNEPNQFKILNSLSSTQLTNPKKSSRDHDCLSQQIGEDSYFLRNDSLGVADGVGGWSGKPGANSAWFSNQLMHHCSFELSRYENTEDEVFVDHQSIDPVEILQIAYEKSLHESKQEGIIGSTTALVAILRDDELRIANLGDCCCSIIRGNDYIFRSEEQQHSFNYPVQIGTNSKSTPLKHAQRYTIKVQKDDIVILSSDGLVDNLFDEDILEEVIKYKPCVPEKVSESLALRAKTVSIDQFAVASPFSQRANEEGIHYVGGKNDDISVLVAVVRDL